MKIVADSIRDGLLPVSRLKDEFFIRRRLGSPSQQAVPSYLDPMVSHAALHYSATLIGRILKFSPAVA